MGDNKNAIYDAKTLGYPKMFVLGLQHMFAMFGATVLVPALTGLSVSATLLFAGLGTLLFHFLTKGKVPAFLGSSFAFIAGYKAVAWTVEIVDGKEVETLHPELLPYACIGVLAAGALYLVLAALIKAFGQKRVMRFFPPVVTGPIIIAIGLTLSKTAIDSCKDSAARSYLPSGIVDTLSSLDFVQKGLNVCILGASDAGKTFLAKALGIQSCLKYRTSYNHCESFLETLVALKQADYTAYQKKVQYYIKLDLLILDDFLLHTITDEREIKVLFEVMEKRSELSKSTIVCSQREPKSWASMILNDEVSANAILKRATKHYTVFIKV